MAKRIMQFRYYGPGNEMNQPAWLEGNGGKQEKVNASHYTSGSIFTNYLDFTKLGIQALPGTIFYLNDSVEGIIIGSTGIYELDLEGISTITNLKFAGESLNLIDTQNTCLIIDVVYEKGVSNS